MYIEQQWHPIQWVNRSLRLIWMYTPASVSSVWSSYIEKPYGTRQLGSIFLALTCGTSISITVILSGQKRESGLPSGALSHSTGVRKRLVSGALEILSPPLARTLCLLFIQVHKFPFLCKVVGGYFTAHSLQLIIAMIKSRLLLQIHVHCRWYILSSTKMNRRRILWGASVRNAAGWNNVSITATKTYSAAMIWKTWWPSATEWWFINFLFGRFFLLTLLPSSDIEAITVMAEMSNRLI